MDTMPSAYETTYEGGNTVDQSQSGPPPIALNRAYIREIPAILKIVQMVCNLIILIAAGSARFYTFYAPGGWVSFVAGFTLVCTVVLFILHLFNIIYRLPPQRVLVEMIALIVFSALHLIGFIVAATSTYYGPGAVITCAIFLLVNCVLYAVECFLRFRVHQAGGGTLSFTTQHRTTTTTTVTTTEPGPAYSVP